MLIICRRQKAAAASADAARKAASRSISYDPPDSRHRCRDYYVTFDSSAVGEAGVSI